MYSLCEAFLDYYEFIVNIPASIKGGSQNRSNRVQVKVYIDKL